MTFIQIFAYTFTKNEEKKLWKEIEFKVDAHIKRPRKAISALKEAVGVLLDLPAFCIDVTISEGDEDYV
jgi:hypothetical protein